MHLYLSMVNVVFLDITTKHCAYSFKIKWLNHDHCRIWLSPTKENKGEGNKEDREFLVFRLTKVQQCLFSMCKMITSRLQLGAVIDSVVTRWRSEEQRKGGIWMIFQFPFWTIGFVTREGQHFHRGWCKLEARGPCSVGMDEWQISHISLLYFIERYCW